MSDYWAKRQQEAHRKIADKTIADCEKQLAKYYRRAMQQTIKDAEAVYDHIRARNKDGNVTPADLYALDKYWKMQQSLKEMAQELGDEEIELLSEEFEKEWEEIYSKTARESDISFATVSEGSAKAMIDTVWLSDGKNFSQRIWKNTEKLVETLNEELVNCVVTGKSTKQLREKLQERFEVSRRQANTLIRTEAAHIQIEAARKRYQDLGLTHYKFFADTDERTCHGHSKSCKELDGKVFKLSEMKAGFNAPPMHPNCRCSTQAVLDTEQEKEIMDKEKEKKPLEQEMQDLISEIEGEHARYWLYDFNGKLPEIKEMPPEKQKNWLGRCAKCGKAYVKDSDKAHRQKYCAPCQGELKMERDADKSVDAMYKRRLAKGMTEDEAWEDIEEFWDRKERGDTNRGYIPMPEEWKRKKKTQKRKKSVVSDAEITNYCIHCGKKMTYKHSEGRRAICEECKEKLYPSKGVSLPKSEGQSDFCFNCGKKLSRRDKQRKNNPYYMCAQCKKKILDSEYGRYHKRRGFSDEVIASSYRNTENPMIFKLEPPSRYYKEKFIEQEKKKKKLGQKLSPELASIINIDTKSKYFTKKELEKIENMNDSHFSLCEECGKYYFKDNPKANNQKRCSECKEKYDKEYKKRKAQEARDKAKLEEAERKAREDAQKAKEEAAALRKKYKAEWARKYRAKKKNANWL